MSTPNIGFPKQSKAFTRCWNGRYFRDYVGTEHFDILGNALAVLYEIADENQMESIFEHAISKTTPYGIPMGETFLPALSDEESKDMERGEVIWPFVNGYMLKAMILHGGQKWKQVAQSEFEKWNRLSGHFEWYSVSTGKGYGSSDQTWSAALYIIVHNLLFENQ